VFEALKAEGWSVVHTRTLQLQEDALAVKLSPDGRLIAVSLMDSTIKVFFVDSLKFFLSLY
jgi:U3 small nucleolar RNA-associated protein 12